MTGDEARALIETGNMDDLLAAAWAGVDALDAAPAHEARSEAFESIAALMGSNEEWDSAADYLEWTSEDLNKAQAKIGEPGVSDQDTESLKHWRAIADRLGIEHDGEEEEEEGICFDCDGPVPEGDPHDGYCAVDYEKHPELHTPEGAVNV